MILLVAACRPNVTPTPVISPTITSTSRFSTHEGPIVAATLPPTWTHTPTPLPSNTFTPTPITPTVTDTPVPDLATLCDSFTFDNSVSDGHRFGWNDTISMVYGTPLTTVRDDAGVVLPLTVRFLATHTRSGENLGVQLEGGQIFGMQLPVDQLPYPGLYIWRLAVIADGIADQCVHTGYFFVNAQIGSSTPEATVESTLEVTPESTLDLNAT